MVNHRHVALTVLGFSFLFLLGLMVAPALGANIGSPPVTGEHRRLARALAAPQVDLEEIVLQQAALAIHCSSPVIVISATYRITCTVFPGHQNYARIERYPSEAEAYAAFVQASSSGTVATFHGHVAYTRQYAEHPGTGLPMNHRYHGWQASRWLIVSHAFDDTHFLYAYRPETVSEAIYQAAVEHGLFSSGSFRPSYLPLIVQFHSLTPTPTVTPTATWTPSPTPTVTPTSLTPLPDLLVDWMKIELETGGSCAYTSPQLGMRVQFSNIGAAAAGPFVLDVNDNQRSFSGLPAGESLTTWLAGSFIWPGINTSIVDATNIVQESDEDNNRLSQIVPIPTLPPSCTPTATPTFTRTATPTSTPTVTTWPTGDLWWSRQVHVYDAGMGSQAGISGARVNATALSINTCTTDSSGNCTVSVHAHDTGTVYISVTADGFLPFSGNYPGMPSSGTLNIDLSR